MKRPAALNQSRGFFSFAVAIAILAVSSGMAMLAAEHDRETDRRPAPAQQPVRANDVAAVETAAAAAQQPQRSDASAEAEIPLP